TKSVTRRSARYGKRSDQTGWCLALGVPSRGGKAEFYFSRKYRNIGNDSTSNPAMELANVSRFPNEDSVDKGAEVEALEADIGKFINSSNDSGRTINNIEPTESMPRLPVSSRGRPLKPTLKLLELSNAIGAPLPSKRKRKDGASVDRRTKQKAVKPTSAVPRFNEGDITLNRRPRGFLRRKGGAEPCGSRSVVGQTSLANGMAREADQ
nr:protein DETOXIFICATION 49 [Tanacetum cinerariifolium]